MSFRISVTPQRRAAGRFVGKVRRKLQKAYADRPDVTQSAIAEALGVHRSVINRQLRGNQDMTLGRVAELAWALGFDPEFDLVPSSNVGVGTNTPVVGVPSGTKFTKIESQASSAVTRTVERLPQMSELARV